jgi:hypothetical protein
LEADYLFRLLGGLGYRGMIAALAREAYRLRGGRTIEGQRRLLAIGTVERLRDWLETGVLPDPMPPENRLIFEHIAEALVTRGELNSNVLGFLRDLPNKNSGGPGA